jgi:serine/threonine protein kinase
MSTSVCTHCSTPNRAGAKFCVKCGASLIGLTRLKIGQVMHGKYTIVRELGRGGMGAVYLATETIASQQRYVVVKQMLDYYDPNDPQGEAKARKRFEDEAATLAKTTCVGVPQIFAFFSEGGFNYIVMQYIEGRDLEASLTHKDRSGKWVQGQPYPIEQVRQWGIQICRMLEYLASQNIVHRDIKPANLIVDNAGLVWLVDFGTAKAQGAIQSGGQVGLQKSSVYGTEGYAPPEQYTDSTQIGPWSDVYALAATLYHLLTDDDPGDHPFQFPGLSHFPMDWVACQQQALHKNTRSRLTAMQFRERLEQLAQPHAPSSGPTFTWQDGTVCQEPLDLIPVIKRNWTEAEAHWSDRAWEQWFQQLNRHDMLHLAQQVRSRHPESKCVALDEFVRTLASNFPRAALRVSQQQIDLGFCDLNGSRGNSLSGTINVTNTGHGCLHGTVSASALWLSVSPSRIELTPGGTVLLTFKIDPVQLKWGQDAHDRVTLVTSGGQADILCSVRTPSRWASRSLWETLTGMRGGLFGSIWSAVGGAAFSVIVHWVFLWLVLAPLGNVNWFDTNVDWIVTLSAFGGTVIGVWIGWRSNDIGLSFKDWRFDHFGVSANAGIISLLIIGGVFTLDLGGWEWVALVAFVLYLANHVGIPIFKLGWVLGATWAVLMWGARRLIEYGLDVLLSTLIRFA